MTINVKDFGAVGNGTVDDSAKIQLAFNASVDGDIIIFPAGSYRISKAITVTKRVTVVGGKSTIRVTADNAFFVTGAESVIEGFTFEGNRLNTNHTAVVIAANRVIVRDCDGSGMNKIVDVVAGVWHSLQRIRARNLVTGTIEIGNVVGTIVTDVGYDTDPGYAEPQFGIKIWGEGCRVSDSDFIHAGKCLWLVTVPTRNNTWNFFNMCSFDTSDYGIYIENRNMTVLSGQMFDQCWASSHRIAGVWIESTGAQINGLTFSDCIIINNQGHGLVMVGNADNVDLNGCTFSGNSVGNPRQSHNIYSNITGKKYIRGCQFSNWGGFASNVGYDLLRAEQDGVCVFDGNISMGENGGGYISGSPIQITLGKNFGNLPSA